ncbi:Fe-S oxidoreductase [Notoacmeibacter marinus]|uniref:Fe-S oxidoreductase n=1 Tax=Notoacmeibacter marinus TaxID=1876515 RepID=A0A231V030_9HYPH|nr:(Fe-S)-binding protein [Notoacmeibacter marinus]OXT01565.1 Fe-S oxidoreductase [Notoacmeibacter marinus]
MERGIVVEEIDKGKGEQSARPTVGLFVTCLVDLFRPTVGFAAIKLLEESGCDITVPNTQTCCGQPAYNAGHRNETAAIARQVVAAFEAFDYVVAPSGSCAAMIRHHYPALLADDPKWAARAEKLAEKTHELTSFLTDVRSVSTTAAALPARTSATYHDSCSGLRELGVKAQPRALLAKIDNLELKEMNDPEVCCGFGGTFCAKYPAISEVIVSAKTKDIAGTEADLLLAGDMGCLMNMAGRLRREGHRTEVRHVAEILAGMTDTPPIAGSGEDRS